MSGPLHHMHLRKRTTKNVCEPYPARTPGLRLLDKLMYGVGLLAPIALLPQVIRVYQDGDVSGLSIYTWGGLSFVNLLWAFYGYVHNEKPILIANTLVTILNLSIVIGILKYS
jgi:uncharacterized protein with PQ loop repeat